MNENKEICPNCKTIPTRKVFIDKVNYSRHCPACYDLKNKDVSLLWNFKQYFSKQARTFTSYLS